MPNPTRDEIAMAVMRRLRNVDRLTADFALALAENITDDLLALLASKREAEPDVRMFGPIGPHPAPQTPVVVPLWRYPQTAEPDAWMATTTGSQPKEGDEHE